jgi:hypothetical protein
MHLEELFAQRPAITTTYVNADSSFAPLPIAQLTWSLLFFLKKSPKPPDARQIALLDDCLLVSFLNTREWRATPVIEGDLSAANCIGITTNWPSAAAICTM